METNNSSEQLRYRERVLPGPLTFVVLTALFPAVSVVFEPINLQLGMIFGLVITMLAWLFVWIISPVIEVKGSSLRVGVAKIPLAALGEATVIEPSQIFEARGPKLEATAFTAFQGSVKKALRINIQDELDPTPYWLISTRRPEKLKQVLDLS